LLKSLEFFGLVSFSLSATVSNWFTFFRLDDELLRLRLMHDLAMMTSLGGQGLLLLRWQSIIDLLGFK
jgi:hypothetical protein